MPDQLIPDIERPRRDATAYSDLVIRIANLAIAAHVGVSAEERLRHQSLIVSLALGIEACADFTSSDEIGATLDYDLVVDAIHAAAAEEAALVETFADRIAQACAHLSTRVRWSEVTIAKPSVLGDKGLASVTLRRTFQPKTREAQS